MDAERLDIEKSSSHPICINLVIGISAQSRAQRPHQTEVSKSQVQHFKRGTRVGALLCTPSFAISRAHYTRKGGDYLSRSMCVHELVVYVWSDLIPLSLIQSKGTRWTGMCSQPLKIEILWTAAAVLYFYRSLYCVWECAVLYISSVQRGNPADLSRSLFVSFVM